MVTARPRLGNILVRQGTITQAELEAAVLYQLRAESVDGRTLLADASEAGRSGPRSPRLGEALIALGICTELQVAQALAEQMGIPYVDLAESSPTHEALSLLPGPIARQHGVLPLRVEGEALVVSVCGPPPASLIQALQQTLSRPILLACSPESQVSDALKRYEALLEHSAHTGAAAQPAGDDRQTAGAEESCPVTTVNQLVAEATRQGASDVSFEPLEDRVRVQYRIRGQSHTAATLRRSVMRGLIAHIKLMCGMELTERPRPQDGRCHVRVDGRSIELHASTVPGAYGESAILRVIG